MFMQGISDRELNLNHSLLAKSPNSNFDVWIVDGKKDLSEALIDVASRLLRQCRILMSLECTLPCHWADSQMSGK